MSTTSIHYMSFRRYEKIDSVLYYWVFKLDNGDGKEEFWFKGKEILEYFKYKKSPQNEFPQEFVTTWEKLNSAKCFKKDWSLNSIFISEPCLYAILFKCKRFEAQKFCRCIWNVVLPFLRSNPSTTSTTETKDGNNDPNYFNGDATVTNVRLNIGKIDLMSKKNLELDLCIKGNRIDHKVWFKASDIVEILGYNNYNVVMESVPPQFTKTWNDLRCNRNDAEEERQDDIGWEPTTIFISELGLFALTFSSGRVTGSDAVPFSEFIHENILSQIREQQMENNMLAVKNKLVKRKLAMSKLKHKNSILFRDWIKAKCRVSSLKNTISLMRKNTQRLADKT